MYSFFQNENCWINYSTIYKNVILLFQPPYCPEVNPIERVWQYIKYRWRSLLF
ncbi:MAG: transposase, partial [Cyanobacteriota bacterium]|nr:transposase [Cyanobacteriota bacterium]